MKKQELNSKKNLVKLSKNEDIELWAEDEVHFQQYGSRCRMWIPPEEKEPILLHHPTRKSVGYFGAVNLRDGRVKVQRENDKFNADTFWTFLKMLLQYAQRAGKRIVLLVDNAKYHHAILHREWREKHQDTLKLIYLPPYSPDLNPIERLWKLTRRLCIHNRYFPDLLALLQVIEDQFKLWRHANSTVRKLCAIT